MIVAVWEVYPRDSQNAILFKEEDAAKNQNFVDEVDLITQSKIDLCDEDIIELDALGYLWT